MKYQELADLDATPEQDKALTIEWATLLNAMTPEQLQTAPKTPGALLATWVMERLLNDVVAQRLSQFQASKLNDAVRAALDNHDTVTLQAMADAAHISIEVPIPVPPPLPKPLVDPLSETPRIGIMGKMKSWLWMKD